MFQETLRHAAAKYEQRGFGALVAAGLKEAFFNPWFTWFIIPRLRDRIVSADEVYERCSKSGSLWTCSGQTQVTEFPENHPAFDPVLSRTHIGYSDRPESVLELRDVTVFGPGGVVRDADGMFIFLMNSRQNFEQNLLYGGDQLHRENIDTLIDLFGGRSETRREFNVAASLVTHVGQHYGHWLVEFLPQVLGLEVYEERTGRTPTVIVNRDAPRWMRDSLHLLGIPDDRIVEWHNHYATVGRFVQTYPNAVGTTNETTVISPVAYNWLRNRLLEAVPGTATTPDRRFYISRQETGTRYVSNVNEIRPVLDEYDIEVIRPETMTFEEQVQLFSHGALFVGPRGSGMHNVLFSRQAGVIELTTPKWRLQAQHLLCNALGHQYTHVTGTDYERNPETVKEYRKTAFEVDPQELRDTLTQVLETNDS